MDEETYTSEAAQAHLNNQGVSVHAGFPNPSEDVRGVSLDFNQLLVQHRAGTFAFRVRGRAWARFGIFDKDLAVVDRLLEAHSGDLVVWCQEGEAGFGLSVSRKVPDGATTWGVVTSIIHTFRSS